MREIVGEGAKQVIRYEKGENWLAVNVWVHSENTKSRVGLSWLPQTVCTCTDCISLSLNCLSRNSILSSFRGETGRSPNEKHESSLMFVLWGSRTLSRWNEVKVKQKRAQNSQSFGSFETERGTTVILRGLVNISKGAYVTREGSNWRSLEANGRYRRGY